MLEQRIDEQPREESTQVPSSQASEHQDTHTVGTRQLHVRAHAGCWLWRICQAVRAANLECDLPHFVGDRAMVCRRRGKIKTQDASSHVGRDLGSPKIYLLSQLPTLLTRGLGCEDESDLLRPRRVGLGVRLGQNSTPRSRVLDGASLLSAEWTDCQREKNPVECGGDRVKAPPAACPMHQDFPQKGWVSSLKCVLQTYFLWKTIMLLLERGNKGLFKGITAMRHLTDSPGPEGVGLSLMFQMLAALHGPHAC